MGKKGKLAVNTGYYTMDIQEYAVPEPKDDGMVIKIEAFAICGSDQHFVKMKDEHPAGVQGHEFMGRIVAMGKNANEHMHCYGGKLRVGDRVAVYPHITCGTCDSCMTYGDGYCGICEDDFIYGGVFFAQDPSKIKNHKAEIWPHFKGGFAEYCYIFPGTYLWKVPEDMPSEIATLLDPCAVAMRAVEQVLTPIGGTGEGFSISSRCLIVGAGAISIMVAMMLKQMGAKQVIITDFFDEKLEMAKKIANVDLTINTSKITSQERIEYINKVTEGGAHIVINGANHPSSCIESLQMVRKCGYYVEIGNAIDFGAHIISEVNIPAVIFERNAHITSVVANTPACFNRAFEFLKRYKELPFNELITHRFTTLEEIIPTMKLMGNPDYIKGVCLLEGEKNE